MFEWKTLNNSSNPGDLAKYKQEFGGKHGKLWKYTEKYNKRQFICHFVAALPWNSV